MQIEHLTSLIEPLQERASELELQLRVLQSQHELEMKEVNSLLSESEGQKSQLGERIKLLETSKQLVLTEADAKYQDAIGRFESEIEQIQYQGQQELREAQARSESALSQLKECYEREKEKLEIRIADERDRNLKRMQV